MKIITYLDMPFCRVLLEVAIAEPESTVKDPFRNSVIYNICLDIGVALQNIYMEVSWELCYFGKCLIASSIISVVIFATTNP